MNKPSAVVAAIAIALLGVAAYFWADRRDSEITVPEPVDTHETEKATAAPTPEPELELEVSTQDAQELSPPQNEPTAQPVPSSNNIGMHNEVISVDFGIYLALTTVGYDRNEILVRAVQQEYGLTDEELQKYLQFSTKVLQSDTRQQAEHQKAICAKRAEFGSLYEFGNAVNEFSRTARTSQETLARQAKSELGEALYSKISSRVRSKPLPEITEADSAALFMSRNEPLSTVIERFCSYGS